MTKKTIGLNPLEMYLTKNQELETQAQEESPQEPLPQELQSQSEAPQAKGSPTKQRITLHISAALIDRLKNAVYWEPGLTIAGFAEHAFEEALVTLEKERGGPYPERREHRLRGGRPLI